MSNKCTSTTEDSCHKCKCEQKTVMNPQNAEVEPIKENEIDELKAKYTQTCKELEQYRALLLLQYEINNCYRNEIKNLTTRLNEKCKIANLVSNSLALPSWNEQNNLKNGNKILEHKDDSDTDQQEQSTPLPSPRQSPCICNNSYNKSSEVNTPELRTVSTSTKIDANPFIFLTWRFLDLQDKAYTTIQPADKAIFHCSSEYHGPVTVEMLEYLAKSKVYIECYMGLNASMKQVAFGEFDVYPAVYRSNHKYSPHVMLIGECVKASLHCWCQLNCSKTLVKELKKKENEMYK
ncbi:uncharacterized protein LOC142321012 [Lycorma delicatula]|uniref:uncharacterized protein LOC142321012 n=1 Tax=Lycorma delicatula TaxID=130591 RepID=UPI003F514257